jgi:tripartite-type tricarboxylate transporter receptor subunit TctC
MVAFWRENMIKSLLFILLSILCSIESAVAEFPERQLHIVVPFTAGGNVDISARVVGQALQDSLGQSVIVDNKPGANAMIGAELVAHAKPDGYTMLLGTAETLAINPHFYSKINYDALNDFSVVGLIGDFPFALVISPNLNIRTATEFVTLVQKSPKKYNFSSWGVGSTSQIAFELFKNVTNIELEHVPFPGASPAITAVSSGQVQAMMVPLSVAIPQAQSGRVVILGLTSKKRLNQAPEIPTLLEQNFAVEISGWHLLVVPKKTPKKNVLKLHNALNDSLNQPSIQQNLERIGININPTTIDNAQYFLQKEYTRWGEILEKANKTNKLN